MIPIKLGMGPYLLEIFLARSPVPIRTAKGLPSIECSSTPRNPSIIIQAAASSEHLASCIWFLDASVVGSVDHGGLVCPVIVAVAEFEGSCWGCDLGDLARISAAVRDAF